MNFQDELTKRTDEIEKGIREFLPKEEGFAKSMAQAMNYSMLAGGKRLRPLLMQETYRLFGGKEKVIWPFMTGMEKRKADYPQSLWRGDGYTKRCGSFELCI